MAQLSVNTATIIQLIFAWITWKATYSERILVITPVPAYSHYVSIHSIWNALSKRGHDITIITAIKEADLNVSNRKEIYYNSLTKTVENFNFFAIQHVPYIKQLKVYQSIAVQGLDNLMSHAEVKELYRADNNDKFDAVIIELYFCAGLSMFAHRFNASLIGVLSGAITHEYRYYNGQPILTSHPSNWELQAELDKELTFYQRLSNFITTWSAIYETVYNYLDKQQSVMEKYLGKGIPHIRDIVKNMSLILCNQNRVLSHNVPETGNTIYYSNLHIHEKPPPLPNDVKSFLDNATNGFIYVSFGSTVKTKHLPKEQLDVLLCVFSKLPFRILWKFESNPSFKRPDNVFISKWLPQQGVLAHPKIKLFIYQGGYQSTEEAVHSAVPLLGIPFFADQYSNVKKMESLGVAKHIALSELSAELLQKSIWQILNNSSYKRNMIAVRKLSKDIPYDHLDNVVWWIEYVMRHKGTPHIRFSGVDDRWYQRNNADIIAFLSVCSFLTICVIGATIMYALSLAFERYNRN